MKRTPRQLFAALSLFALAACASGGGGQPEDISPTRFAPTLGVNLATMSKTASGVYYTDISPGRGAAAEARKRVGVRYTGWLADGTKIDSSDGLEFPLGTGQVIRGWDDGIAGMSVGGVRLLVIPPELGYGFKEVNGIPRGSVLVFRIELLRVR
jgi:FKBP-type peptidyl-prolyl cis-trans isomerase FkpA